MQATVEKLQEEKKMMDNMVRSLLSPTTPNEPTPNEPTPSEPTPSEPTPATPIQEEKETVQSAEEFFASGPPEKSE